MARKSKRGVADVTRYTGSQSAPPTFGDDRPDDSVTSGTSFFLISLVLFLAIVAGAVVFGTKNIEQNLTVRATASLRAAGYSSVSVEMRGTTVVISGSITTEQTEDGAISAVRSVAGVGNVEGTLWPVLEGELEDVVITGSAMRIDWENDTVVVAGTVATEERKAFVVETLNTTFSTVAVDELEVVEGLLEEPRWLGEALGLVIVIHADLPVGRLIVDPMGELLVVTGETEDKDLRNDLNAIVIVVSDSLGYDVNPAIRLLETGPTIEEIEELQFDLDSVLVDKVVEFESKSSELTTEGVELLEELLIALRLAPEVRIEIAGHTDSKGSAESNLVLSVDRADTVFQYFIDRGEPPERFIVVAHGEDQPTADNGTAEGRARNRRIEFTALEGTT